MYARRAISPREASTNTVSRVAYLDMLLPIPRYLLQMFALICKARWAGCLFWRAAAWIELTVYAPSILPSMAFPLRLTL